jgi:hypothetical protein
VWVRPDVVDLTAHTGLVALPEELWASAGRVRELEVQSADLEALPAWLGELTGLTALRIAGVDYEDHVCPLRKLPDAVGRLTALRKLKLRECYKLTALPAALASLTRLEDLQLTGCHRLEEVPAWVTALTGLKVPFAEWRLRVRNTEGVEEQA